MAGHHVYSCTETDLLAQGMVIALDYFNLPQGNNRRAARQDGKAVAARATDWGVRWTKYLNYQRVQRWNNPVGFAPVPAVLRKIHKTYIRNAHVVDMNQSYIRIWHLTRSGLARSHNGLAGSLIGVNLMNWRQSTRRAQGAAGVAGVMTPAEIQEVMTSPMVANHPAAAGVTAPIMRIRLLLLMLPEFLCQLGSATTQHSFL